MRSEKQKLVCIEVESELLRGDWIDPALAQQTVGHWSQRYLSSVIHLEPKTVQFYELMTRKHVLPFFEHAAIGAVDRTAVDQFVAQLYKNGVSPRTAKGALQTLRNIFKAAQRSGVIRANPCDDVQTRKMPRREMTFLTVEQVLRLADDIAQPYDLLVRLAAFTGMRAGEIAALRVRRIHLLRGTIEVAEALKDIGGKLEFGPTKNHESRRVGLPRFLCDEIGAYITATGKAPNDLLFTAPKGGPLRHAWFYRQVYKPAAKRTGMPDELRFHDLRHTCAAILIEQGAHPRAIMERLGHSSITVTMDTYGHLLPSLDETLSDRLNAVHDAARKAVSMSARGADVVQLDDMRDAASS